MMPEYLLDTDLCITLIRRQSEKAERRLVGRQVTDVMVSTLTVAELEYGVAKSSQPRMNRQRLDQFLLPLQLLAFDSDAALAYGTVRAKLEARGQVIGPIDLLLAAQAISREMTFVTSNRGEFGRVDGLEVEDWTK